MLKNVLFLTYTDYNCEKLSFTLPETRHLHNNNNNTIIVEGLPTDGVVISFSCIGFCSFRYFDR